MQQAQDFGAETEALAAVVTPLSAAELGQATLFKGWTIEDVIGHLHMFNVAAQKALDSDAAFGAFFQPLQAGIAAGKSLRDLQYPWLGDLAGRALVAQWHDTAMDLATQCAGEDPKRRVKWAGPDMSVLSCITARQMETWAHGQEVFDVLGQDRPEADRIRNIAHLGVSTFGWTFVNRGLPVPDPAPFVRLTGPSGAVWEWNTPQDDNTVTGSAVEFAQVVTQVRSVGDTALVTTGAVATDWMALAQCFAGPPEDPPAPGARHRETVPNFVPDAFC